MGALIKQKDLQRAREVRDGEACDPFHAGNLASPHRSSEQPVEAEGQALRGLVIGLPLGLALWAIILSLVYLL